MRILHEFSEILLGEVSVLIRKSGILSDKRRHHVTGRQINKLAVADIDTGRACCLHKQIFVNQRLPCSVSYLLLLFVRLS